MPYKEIDHALQNWAISHGLNILTKFGGRDDRFTYITNLKNDCYQIAVTDLGDSKFVITIFFVDGTGNKDDYEFNILTNLNTFSNDLESAYEKIFEL
jgi:hypothetical protein